MATEKKFNAAVNIVQSLPKSGPIQTSIETMLKFYSYFKQATEGPNKQTKPAFYEVVKKTKWDAWNKLGNMSKEEAMQRYIDEFLKIVESTSHTNHVEELVKSLSTFYEAVDDEGIELLLGPTMDQIFSKTGSKKLQDLKNKILKSQNRIESNNEYKHIQTIQNIINNEDDRITNKENLNNDNTRTDNNSLYTEEVPLVGNGIAHSSSNKHNGYTKWYADLNHTESNIKPMNGDVKSLSKTYSTPTTMLPTSSSTKNYNSQVTENNSYKFITQPQYEESNNSVIEEINNKEMNEIGIMAEAIGNIEAELTKVADKLNIITNIYKRSFKSELNMPTLSLILIWPVITQLLFTWFNNKHKYSQIR